MKNGWIDVEKELPKNHAEVLVLRPDSYMYKIMIAKHFEGEFFTDFGDVLGVSAWQPLPEAEYR